MKKGKKSTFFIVAALILVFSYLAVFGCYYYTGDIKHTIVKGVNDIRWGIDIRGGVEATFKPANNYAATEEELNSAKAIIEKRLISSGVTDYELYADSGSKRIILRFPWKADETEYEPLEAIKEVAATASLTFRKGASYDNIDIGSDGEQVFKTPSGDTAEILLDGSSIAKAYAAVDQSSSTVSYVVSLEFTDEGAAKFEEITADNVGQQISIWMDDVMLSAPNVNEAITGKYAQISGTFTAKEANDLANQINAGALPFTLQVASNGTINPTLGTDSLTVMAIAGIIAFILVALFMIMANKMNGIIAVIGLIGQMGFCFAAITLFFPAFDSFTMTLPGIAGIILSIGMGVDANIITSGRVEEELRSGRTLDGAIERGTQNSLSAIIDGNVTVIIVALILLLVFGPTNLLSFIFGASTTGTIYAFGFTLLMGVIANFIMGITATRLMMKSIIRFKPMRKKWFYGGAFNE